MDNYIMQHTGKQLDEAISKFNSDYLKPDGTIKIGEEENNTIVDVSQYANAEIAVPTISTASEELVITPSEGDVVVKESDKGGYSKVTINPIPSNYIGSKIVKKEAEEFQPQETDRVIPSGQYLKGAQTIKAVSSRYVGSGITKKAAETFTPSSSPITIPANTYLEGNQIINPIPDSYLLRYPLTTYVTGTFQPSSDTTSVTINNTNLNGITPKIIIIQMTNGSAYSGLSAYLVSAYYFSGVGGSCKGFNYVIAAGDVVGYYNSSTGCTITPTANGFKITTGTTSSNHALKITKEKGYRYFCWG